MTRLFKISVLFLVVCGFSAYAQVPKVEHSSKAPLVPHQLDPMKRLLVEPYMALHYADEIGLTRDQRTYIEAQLKEAKTRFGVLEGKIEAEQRKMGQLMGKHQVSEQEAVAQMRRLLDVEREIKLTNLAYSIRVRNQLSPEQRRKLANMQIPPPPPPPPPPHAPLPPPPGASIPHAPAPRDLE